MAERLSALRVNDRVLSEIATGYSQAESILTFVAKSVPVTQRSGKIIQFGREQFSIVSTKRVPYAAHQRSRVSGYSNANFVLEQHTHLAEIAFEEYEEALAGDAGVDLKELAVLDAVAKIEQSVEAELYNLITTPGNYESSNVILAAGTNQFSNSGSDPEMLVRNWKEIVRAQVGVYPNKAVISTDVYNALTLHPAFRERTKHTQIQTTDLDLLAAWFGLPGGIKVAQRVEFIPSTGKLTDMFPAGTMLLFYDGTMASGTIGPLTEKSQPVFRPAPGLLRSTPNFAYNYVLAGGLRVSEEYVDVDYDVIKHIVRLECAVVGTSVGETNKFSAGVLVTGLVS